MIDQFTCCLNCVSRVTKLWVYLLFELFDNIFKLTLCFILCNLLCSAMYFHCKNMACDLSDIAKVGYLVFAKCQLSFVDNLFADEDKPKSV